ncbi:MAG TPA: hypothetical protein VGF99_15350, partial [Myxococcota bacterium]
ESQSRVDVVVDTSEFNCLSSAVLFAIAADGLVDRPRGMLSTTHAFVRATVDGHAVDVETTTPGGFAVDRRKLVTREFLRQRGVGEGMSEAALLKDLQSPEEVSLVGLIAALYSNRAVHAIRRGDVDDAALAFDRSTQIATGALKTRVANWRAGLLNNAALGLLDAGRADEARALFVIGLDGATGETRSNLQHNLAAAIIALATRARDAGRYAEAVAWLEAANTSGGVDAKTSSSLASMRAELDGHLAGGDASRCRTQAVVDDRARCLTVAADAALKDKRFDRALDLAREASSLSSSSSSSSIAAPVLHNAIVSSLNLAAEARDCPRVEALSRELVVVRARLPKLGAFDADRQMAACSVDRGNDALDAGRLDAAAADYARAATFLGDAPELKHNRALVELRLAEPHAKAGRCDDARPHARRAADHSAELGGDGVRLLEICANNRAVVAAKDKRWAVAAEEVRLGLRDAPTSESLKKNLAIMVHNHAVAELNARRCDEARALLPELRAAKDDVVADIERLCPHR